ncbi:MAG: hypothetical protein WBA22_18780 [Candidatus Methanofastidiosia archaeon]
MADILLIGIREENKADFVVEFIKGLMSRGLSVSYAGAYYSEIRNGFVYDNIVNLLFFSSTYFREAHMKSKDFSTWKGFLDNINFDAIDERLLIYVNTYQCRDKLSKEYFESLKEGFNQYLQDNLGNLLTELIKDFFGMSFLAFKSHYPEIIQILDIDPKSFVRLRNQVARKGYIEIEKRWESDEFVSFKTLCEKMRKEILEKGAEQVMTRLEGEREEVKDMLERFCHLEEEYAELIDKQVLNYQDQEKLESLEEAYAQLETIHLETEIFDKGRPENDTLKELEKSQETVEIACFRDPLKRQILFEEFLTQKTILSAVESTQKKMYFDILRKVARRKILCIYQRYISAEEEKNEVELFFFPERYRGDGGGEISNKTSTEQNRHRFDCAKNAYSHDSIDEIIDNHVLTALHPSLIDIRFPVNGFMLEVDPEEPEIGFLSRRITVSRFEKHEESLGIDTDLRKHLRIYDLVEGEIGEAKKSFRKLEKRQKMESEMEDILIFGRVEHLYGFLIGNGAWKSIYKLVHLVSRWLAILLPPSALISYFTLRYFLLSRPEYIPSILQAIGAFVGVSFAFWTLRAFILNYVLEPMYSMAKWFSYIFLAVLILGRIEFLGIEFLMGFSSFLVFSISLIFANYVSSGIFYELNESFKIIGFADVVQIENSDDQKKEMVKILKCGRFQTIVQTMENSQLKDDIRVFLNLNFFKKICCIRKKTRTLPREMAYSSGAFIKSENQKEKSKDVQELTYRKSKAWGSWRILKNIFFDKGQIELKQDPVDRYSSNERSMYFGSWNSVAKHMGGAVPLSAQSVLFRSMIILAAISLLVFHFLFSHRLMAADLTNWIREIGPMEVFLFLFVPSVSILFASRLRVQFWKISVIAILYFFLLIQTHRTLLLVTFFSIFLVLVFTLLRFPIKQILFYFLILIHERLKGDIVSIVDIFGSPDIEGDEKSLIVTRGTEIKRNPLVTEFSARLHNGLEEKRVYFNEDFFRDIIMSGRWYLKRQKAVSKKHGIWKALVWAVSTFSRWKKHLQM